MIDPDDRIGICQYPEYRSTPATPSLWESRRGSERWEEAKARHARARVLCWQCPVRPACEYALTDFECEDVPVDGVMAARYSDVVRSVTPREEILTHCEGCGVRLRRRADPRPPADDQRRHAGEGLCTDCHPKMTTQSRRTA